jgi:hypothetical protein
VQFFLSPSLRYKFFAYSPKILRISERFCGLAHHFGVRVFGKSTYLFSISVHSTIVFLPYCQRNGAVSLKRSLRLDHVSTSTRPSLTALPGSRGSGGFHSLITDFTKMGAEACGKQDVALVTRLGLNFKTRGGYSLCLSNAKSHPFWSCLLDEICGTRFAQQGISKSCFVVKSLGCLDQE